jgi:hypothetical protein
MKFIEAKEAKYLDIKKADAGTSAFFSVSSARLAQGCADFLSSLWESSLPSS